LRTESVDPGARKIRRGTRSDWLFTYGSVHGRCDKAILPGRQGQFSKLLFSLQKCAILRNAM
jgi:hypothetical protein